MRSRPLALAVLSLALAACGESLVDHGATELQRGPGSGACSGDAPVSCRIGGSDQCRIEGPAYCGSTCADCTASVVPPASGAVACIPGDAPGRGLCGYECTGGLLKCADGCCAIEKIAAGAAHTCAITSAGALYCWGANDAGQVTGTSSSGPVARPLKRFDVGAGVVRAVATGVAHTCAAFASEVRCWGRGFAGAQPGSRALAGVTALAAGTDHTCALLPSGAVECWGATDQGQNGGGTPILSGAVAIAAGAHHTCALMGGNREVRCWGSRAAGQLGDGTVSPAFSVEPVAASTSGTLSAIAASAGQTCAAENRGEANAVQCWGDSLGPAFGLDDPQLLPTAPREGAGEPVVDFRALGLAVGAKHVCVRRGTTDAVKCFGPSGAKGELGGVAAGAEAVDVPGTIGATSVAAGGEHACAVVPGGGLRCWGSNASGQLGDGTTVTPGLAGDGRPLGTPVTVSGL